MSTLTIVVLTLTLLLLLAVPILVSLSTCVPKWYSRGVQPRLSSIPFNRELSLSPLGRLLNTLPIRLTLTLLFLTIFGPFILLFHSLNCYWWMMKDIVMGRCPYVTLAEFGDYTESFDYRHRPRYLRDIKKTLQGAWDYAIYR